MTFDFGLFSNTSSLSNPGHVTLPYGSLKPVTLVADIQLSPTLLPHSVLFVPDFKYNLLPVEKFFTDNYCCTTFYPTQCAFQDLSTTLIVAVGKKAGGLYIFYSFHLKAKISVPAANASVVSASSSLPCSQASTSYDKPTYSSHDLDI